MELKFIPVERIEAFKDYVKQSVEKRPSISPSDLVSRSFYVGFTEFRFTDARSIAEQTKGVYLAEKNR